MLKIFKRLIEAMPAPVMAWWRTHGGPAWDWLREHALKRKRELAVAVSLGLHLFVFWLMLLQGPASLPGGGSQAQGSGAGDGFSISLVTGKVDVLEVKPQVDDPAETITTLAPVAQPDATVLTMATPDLMPVLSQLDPSTPTLPSLATSGAAGTGGGEGGGAGDDLWNAIAPCWAKVANGDTKDVTLEVSFSPDGSLSVPPVIDRDVSAKVDDQSLNSEAKALSALAACGKYPMAEGRTNVKVNFPHP